jgi:hypothetical protein
LTRVGRGRAGVFVGGALVLGCLPPGEPSRLRVARGEGAGGKESTRSVKLATALICQLSRNPHATLGFPRQRERAVESRPRLLGGLRIDWNRSDVRDDIAGSDDRAFHQLDAE